jgi:hypothetical protein
MWAFAGDDQSNDHTKSHDVAVYDQVLDPQTKNGARRRVRVSTLVDRCADGPRHVLSVFDRLLS